MVTLGAVSSAVEQVLYTHLVGSSILSPPTIASMSIRAHLVQPPRERPEWIGERAGVPTEVIAGADLGAHDGLLLRIATDLYHGLKP